jgi:uncharacterized protein (DUF302 family)
MPASHVTTKDSPWPVQESVDRLVVILDAREIKLFTVIDHSAEAEAAGLKLRDTKLVIFGNPRAGTPIMQAEPVAALDLPMKILVWADGDQTKLSYTSASALAERYGLSDELAAPLAAVDALTDALIAG